MKKLFIIFTILISARSFAQCDYTIVHKGNVLQGNFPRTYKQELRKWGFQKEKY